MNFAVVYPNNEMSAINTLSGMFLILLNRELLYKTAANQKGTALTLDISKVIYTLLKVFRDIIVRKSL